MFNRNGQSFSVECGYLINYRSFLLASFCFFLIITACYWLLIIFSGLLDDGYHGEGKLFHFITNLKSLEALSLKIFRATSSTHYTF